MQLQPNRLRTDFTLFWEGLGRWKTVAISFIAAVLAFSFLTLAKRAFPESDFSSLEVVLVTAISGVIASFIKDFIKG